MADEKVDVSSSLVSLRLVKEGPGKPSDAEEQVALSERRLSDPSATLRAAGVTDGCWLLAAFAAGAGGFGRAAVATPSPPRARFERLLRQAGMRCPDTKVLRLLERHLPAAMIAVFDARAALELYQRGALLPGTPTVTLLRQATGVSLGGPLLGPYGEPLTNLLTGVGPCGRPLVAKLLSEPASRAVEMQLCDALQLSPWDDPVPHPHFMVRASPLDVQLDSADRHDEASARRHDKFTALLMLRHPVCLAEVLQLPGVAIARGARQLLSALTFLHAAHGPDEAPWVHMDVKPANVLINSDGDWLLSDFGSAVRSGGLVRACTDVFLPPPPEQRCSSLRTWLRARAKRQLRVQARRWATQGRRGAADRAPRPRAAAAAPQALRRAAEARAPASSSVAMAATTSLSTGALGRRASLPRRAARAGPLRRAQPRPAATARDARGAFQRGRWERTGKLALDADEAAPRDSARHAQARLSAQRRQRRRRLRMQRCRSGVLACRLMKAALRAFAAASTARSCAAPGRSSRAPRRRAPRSRALRTARAPAPSRAALWCRCAGWPRPRRAPPAPRPPAGPHPRRRGAPRRPRPATAAPRRRPPASRSPRPLGQDRSSRARRRPPRRRRTPRARCGPRPARRRAVTSAWSPAAPPPRPVITGPTPLQRRAARRGPPAAGRAAASGPPGARAASGAAPTRRR